MTEKKSHNLLARCTYAKDDVVAFKNRGKNAIFSNFYPFDFAVEGLTFHSVEQYYHWRRLEGAPKYRETMLSFDGERHAWKCFNYSRNRWVKEVIETDLEKRIAYMREGLRHKLEHCEGFREALLKTGDKVIAELNQTSKPDDIWAVNKTAEGYEGSNILGKLLMELRESILV